MKERCYNIQHVIEGDEREAVSEAWRMPNPISSCISQNSGSTVGEREDFYFGHLPIEKVRGHYQQEVSVVYTRGEYGEFEDQPLTRVSYGIVVPVAEIVVK